MCIPETAGLPARVVIAQNAQFWIASSPGACHRAGHFGPDPVALLGRK
jgi:hypothetical protein